MSTVAKYWRFLTAQWKVNLASAMAYRVSFLSQTIFMFLNDVLLLFIWWVLLERFPDIGGWGMSEIWLMWGLSAGGFGLMAIFCGNSYQFGELIAAGQLDYYLALPKNPLLHILVSRMNMSGAGDLIFGLLIGAMGCYATRASYLLFLLFMTTSGAILAGFFSIWQCLPFFIGRGDVVGRQIGESLISFSTYPGTIFQGAARFITHFVIPAGFAVYLPVELLASFTWKGLLSVLLAALVVWVIAVLVFHTGLRRYESGNQMVLRG